MSKGEYDPSVDLFEADQVATFLNSEGKNLSKNLPKNTDWHHTQQSSALPELADVPETIQPLSYLEHKFDAHSARPGDVPTAGLREVTTPAKPIYDPNAPETQTARYNPREPLAEGSLAEEAVSTRDLPNRAPPNFKDLPKVQEPALKSQYDYKETLRLNKKSKPLVFMRHKATGEWHQIKLENGVYMRKIGKGPWEPVPLD